MNCARCRAELDEHRRCTLTVEVEVDMWQPPEQMFPGGPSRPPSVVTSRNSIEGHLCVECFGDLMGFLGSKMIGGAQA